MTDRQQLLEAFRSAKGIVDHEFSQEVIDASREADEARQQRILNGETTFVSFYINVLNWQNVKSTTYIKSN